MHDSQLGEAPIQGDEQGYFADRACDSQALRETLEWRGLLDGIAWKMKHRFPAIRPQALREAIEQSPAHDGPNPRLQPSQNTAIASKNLNYEKLSLPILILIHELDMPDRQAKRRRESGVQFDTLRPQQPTRRVQRGEGTFFIFIARSYLKSLDL